MKWVIKLGSSALTAGSAELNFEAIGNIARQIADLKRAGQQVVIVSSGAIAAGRARIQRSSLTHPLRTRETVADKQVLAAIGQVSLMSLWQTIFQAHQLEVAQVLLTRADLDHRERYLNARDTIDGLLELGVIPIINENDAVATAEIKVGDNDNLSACVAVFASADRLVLLTDQEGLMTANPKLDPSAKLIPEIQTIDSALSRVAGASTSGLGTGGMATKIQAAQVARSAGVPVTIASYRQPQVLLRLMQGEAVGTLVPALASRLESRKRWILAGPVSQGFLQIDDGAKAALIGGKKSLLPSGIVAVNGQFQRGDVVKLHANQAHEIGRGLVRYSSDDLQKIKGLHSDHILTRLTYHLGDAVVHRDDLVIH